ncbi:MAG: 5'-nucleotidase [Legionellales bacterium RIFCSPHIGHO2_12_FULL_35_11]|nr:MAG: 5'-nucleotidase [Legionellales bacterium RIFCSPHIGHO2_12_FULL_35_11]
MTQKVFVNRTLNLKKIKYLGFDMDHTIIRYNSKNFESMVYELVVNYLVENKHYPEEIKKYKFDFNNAIRGLVVDSTNGNILKLSRYGAIRQSYHGIRPISFVEQKQIYRSIYVDLNSPNYIVVDTAFSIAFCVLFGQLVSFKDKNNQLLPSYETIALDILYSVDKIHAEGNLKKHISENLDKFVCLDNKLVNGLLRYKDYGKKLFLLTNADYEYTKVMLDYVINSFLPTGKTWEELFEFTITLSNKPRFFYDNLKFLNIMTNDGKMTNLNGQIVPGIYQGGNAKKFTDDLGLNGDEILYIGDHIYGDILRLKKDCNWRTALVVDELGTEITGQVKSSAVEKNISLAMNLKAELETRLIELLSKRIETNSGAYNRPLQKLASPQYTLLHEDSSTDSTKQFEAEVEFPKRFNDKIENIQTDIRNLDNEIANLLKEQGNYFNSAWGRVFRSGIEESYFAYQVERYACIYMEKLSDLLEQSPLTYFRANKRRLAHDPE